MCATAFSQVKYSKADVTCHCSTRGDFHRRFSSQLLCWAESCLVTELTKEENESFLSKLEMFSEFQQNHFLKPFFKIIRELISLRLSWTLEHV